MKANDDQEGREEWNRFLRDAWARFLRNRSSSQNDQSNDEGQQAAQGQQPRETVSRMSEQQVESSDPSASGSSVPLSLMAADFGRTEERKTLVEILEEALNILNECDLFEDIGSAQHTPNLNLSCNGYLEEEGSTEQEDESGEDETASQSCRQTRKREENGGTN